MNFTAIDAFCGSGGLSIGLRRAGFDVRLGFDSDPKCIATIRNNKDIFRHEAVCADIASMLNGYLLGIVKLEPGELDLLAGGPPCQGFSVQRTIGSDLDNRNLLVDDYAELILEVMPKFFLMENVVGIGGKRGREILEQFKHKISSAGYGISESVLDAQNFGVPQRRRRVFVIGQYGGNSLNTFQWPETISIKKTVRDAIGNLPEAAKSKKFETLHGHVSDRLSALNLERIRAVKAGEGRTSLPENLLAECHRRDAAKIGHRNVYGRMSWDSVSPTITAKFDSFTRGQFGHPEADRSITLLEGALLQTFPKNFQFIGNKVEVARQIGNAVPPNLGFAVGSSIIKALTIVS